MAKTTIDKATTLEEAHEAARLLWRGHYGYDCPNCGQGCYGRSEDWIHAHLLEHLVEALKRG